MTLPSFSVEERRAVRWILGLIIAILLGGNMLLLSRVQKSFDNMANKIEQLIIDQTAQNEKQKSLDIRIERVERKVDSYGERLIDHIEKSR